MLLRVLDFETTGTAPPAQVVEAGVCDLRKADGDWEIGSPVARLHGVDRITCETRAVHHIDPATVQGLPPFDPSLFLDDSRRQGAVAIVAHHANFEQQWLTGCDLPLICTYKSALRVWPEAPAHGNQCLRYWLEEQGLTRLEPDLAQPAHRAGPDAYATAHLLKALLARASIDDLIAWTKEPAALTKIPIGKQRGAPWADVEEGFLRWMLRQADMDTDLKWNAQRELDRRSRRAGDGLLF